MAGEYDLTEDELGRLVLKRPGQDDVVDVRLARAFPLSLPGRHVSVRSPDGKELLLIDDAAVLPRHLRETIERWLDRTQFVPRITRVDEVDVRFGYQQWKVQTDRGPVDFRVQEREDIRFLPDGRFRLKDADGNIYELPRHEELDPGSRRAVTPVV